MYNTVLIYIFCTISETLYINREPRLVFFRAVSAVIVFSVTSVPACL